MCLDDSRSSQPKNPVRINQFEWSGKGASEFDGYEAAANWILFSKNSMKTPNTSERRVDCRYRLELVSTLIEMIGRSRRNQERTKVVDLMAPDTVIQEPDIRII